MPYLENIEFLDAYDTVTESELLETANIVFPPYDIIQLFCCQQLILKLKR